MFGSYEPFLEIFSSKKFSRVVVYCSVIKVPVVLSQATALIFYQICSALSRTFLFFCFAHPLPFRSVSSDSLYRLSHLQGVVNSFFHLFFQRFRLLLSRSPAPGCSASASPAGLISCGFSRPRHQRQVLSYHYKMELSMFFLFFIYFRQFTQFQLFLSPFMALFTCDAPLIFYTLSR